MNAFMKEKILTNANILLISEYKADYQALLEYGFKNIDYIPSSVLANHYFKEHKDELQKYNIALIASSNVDDACFRRSPSYSLEIARLLSQEDTYISMFEHSLEYKGLSNDENKEIYAYPWKYHDIESYLDKTLANALDVGYERQLTTRKKHKKIVPYQYAEVQKLPANIKDIKILAMVFDSNEEFIKSHLKKAGVTNVKIVHDCNPGLEDYVLEHLGEYDIIISTELFSHKLLNLKNEADEQSKIAGRKLVMLATFKKIQNLYRINETAINTSYIFAGQDSDKLPEGTINYTLLPQNLGYDLSVIETALLKYIESINSISKNNIVVEHLKSAEDYNSEYNQKLQEIQEEKKRKELEREPIKKYDMLQYIINQYLVYKKEGLISELPQGLKIEEQNDYQKVTFIDNQTPLCSITLPKK